MWAWAGTEVGRSSLSPLAGRRPRWGAPPLPPLPQLHPRLLSHMVKASTVISHGGPAQRAAGSVSSGHLCPQRPLLSQGWGVPSTDGAAGVACVASGPSCLHAGCSRRDLGRGRGRALSGSQEPPGQWPCWVSPAQALVRGRQLRPLMLALLKQGLPGLAGPGATPPMRGWAATHWLSGRCSAQLSMAGGRARQHAGP